VTELAPYIACTGQASEEDLTASLTGMIEHEEFPCLGARSVFRRENATIRVYDELASKAATPVLLQDLSDFAQAVDPAGGFASFVAIFRGPTVPDEHAFERLLWTQLRLLNADDDAEWNDDVSSDPMDEHFAFSVAGTAFFVVGLHPGASRDARRTVSPTLVFNLHEQFETLRASGKFERLRDVIRERDAALQGSINPMVSDHGSGSEARQYSGRAVESDWVAPFETTA
jgi:FPC/CPF motif-containing protein YcgG